MKDRKTEKSKNAGFSMMELVVVIAIMAVLTSVGLSWYGLIPSTQVKGCVKALVSTLDKTRTNALSFEEAYVELYRTEDGVFVDTVVMKKGTATRTTEQIGKSGIQIQYKIGMAGDYQELGLSDGTDNKLRIAYNRSSGGFTRSYLVDGVTSTDLSGACSWIKISKASIEREIQLVELTGKVVD